MLETMILAFAGMLLLVGAMAIGVLFGRKPISGSCGGLSALGIDAECEICGGNPARCDSARPGKGRYEAELAEELSDDVGRGAIAKEGRRGGASDRAF
jgi:hypothetical protein